MKKALFFIPLVTAVFVFASCVSKGAPSMSEVVVQRVDSNQLSNLRIYIDGKARGTLKVGEIKSYKVPNGYHTVSARFDSNRSTEVAQINAHNSTHVFSVTDNSIMLVRESPVPSNASF